MMSTNKQNHNTSHEMERLVIEVGNPEFEPGLTRLQLEADGQVQIDSRLFKEESRYDYKLEQKEAAELFKRSLASPQAIEAVISRPGLPDEPRYNIEVYRGKECLQRMQVWRSDLPKMGELGAVIRILGQIADRASEGRALL